MAASVSEVTSGRRLVYFMLFPFRGNATLEKSSFNASSLVMGSGADNEQVLLNINGSISLSAAAVFLSISAGNITAV